MRGIIKYLIIFLIILPVSMSSQDDSLSSQQITHGTTGGGIDTIGMIFFKGDNYFKPKLDLYSHDLRSNKRAPLKDTCYMRPAEPRFESNEAVSIASSVIEYLSKHDYNDLGKRINRDHQSESIFVVDTTFKFTYTCWLFGPDVKSLPPRKDLSYHGFYSLFKLRDVNEKDIQILYVDEVLPDEKYSDVLGRMLEEDRFKNRVFTIAFSSFVSRNNKDVFVSCVITQYYKDTCSIKRKLPHYLLFNLKKIGEDNKWVVCSIYSDLYTEHIHRLDAGKFYSSKPEDTRSGIVRFLNVINANNCSN